MQSIGDSIYEIAAHFIGWVVVAFIGITFAFEYAQYKAFESVAQQLVIRDFSERLQSELKQRDLKGINPDYLQALGMLETGRGTNELYKKGHNLFSIKASLGCIPDIDVCYRNYRSDGDSIEDIVRLISTRNRYRLAYRCALMDERKKFFQALQEAGYSESHTYAKDAERVFQEFKCQEISKRLHEFPPVANLTQHRIVTQPSVDRRHLGLCGSGSCRAQGS